ncbi:MAG: hypothetical protein Q9184_005664 [Pyrenodesmia sp. 2 TL-2023]
MIAIRTDKASQTNAGIRLRAAVFMAMSFIYSAYNTLKPRFPSVHGAVLRPAQLTTSRLDSVASTPYSTAAIAGPSSPEAAYRSSIISNQLYQFALGYPPTPPDISPPSGSTGQSPWGEQKALLSGMGSFIFSWDHPADEVYVTGTFDDWAKSIKLDREDGRFVKRVQLPLDQKILYKFVVDGNWTTDHTAPQEEDGANNVNNILSPDRISRPQPPSHDPSPAMMSGVSAESTTAQLAGQVPKESSRRLQSADEGPSDLPGTFPETPANEVSDFSVKPIPATSGLGNPVKLQPGEKVPDPATITSNTVSSTVNDPNVSKPQESEKAFGVAPLPATAGIGNPIHLEPGEKVPDPSTFTFNTTNTHVTTDKQSYEKGSNAPQLPDVVTPQKERDSKGASMFSVPGISHNMIPESSLPMGDAMPLGEEQKDAGAIIQSASADSTTAALAGQIPKETSGVPQIVQESQNEADVDAEAGHSRIAVREKSAMEKELESKVPEAPATSEGTGGQNTGSNTDSNTGSGFAAGEISTPSHGLPASVQQSIDEMNKGSAIAPAVPDVVQESIAESHVSPEAAGDRTAVDEKKAMEDELLKKVPTDNAVGQPAPTASAALTDSGSAIAPTVPDVVQESIAMSHVSPEAAGDKAMVGEKSTMEAELLQKVPTGNAAGQPAPVASAALAESAPAPTDAQSATLAATYGQTPGTAITTNSDAPTAATTSKEDPAPISAPMDAPAASNEVPVATSATTSKGAKSFPTKSLAPPAVTEPTTTSQAPMTTAAAPAATPATEQAARRSGDYSREVSPMTKTGHQETPTVTTGLASSSTAPTSQATSSKASASPPRASTDKKEKRRSGFFGRLKAKFTDKDKK